MNNIKIRKTPNDPFYLDKKFNYSYNYLQQIVYEQFINFDSLNYILITNHMSNVHFEFEFYEDKYLLETLNNQNIVKQLIEEIKYSYVPIMVEITFDIILNKKRINFDRNNMHEVVFINIKPEIEYERN